MTETEVTKATYQRLKESIRQTYPQGWFVAIAHDGIVAASADFRQLKELVRAGGLDPRSVLILEAGANDPDFVNIFAIISDR